MNLEAIELKWDKLGMLEGVDGLRRLALATKLEEATLLMMKIGNTKYVQYSNVMFPIIVRLEKYLSKISLLDLLDEIYDLYVDNANYVYELEIEHEGTEPFDVDYAFIKKFVAYKANQFGY